MLPKPIRALFYWILRSGPLGRFVADIIAWIFYLTVKIFRIPPKQDIAGLTVISHKHKFIFFGIPKVASRSFFHYFVQQNKEAFEIEWMEKRGAFFEAVKQYPDYYKFSFVRNPWARIVSCYKSKVEDNIIGKRARVLSFYKGLKGGMPFGDFVTWLETQEGQNAVADRHWISQHCFLCDEEGNTLCDFVGKFESLEDDWKKVCDHLKLPYQPLSQKGYVSAEGKTNNPAAKGQDDKPIQKIDYRDTFNDQTRDIIARRYAKDIEIYGYSFDE